MYSIIELHDNIVFYLIILCVLVFWTLFSSLTGDYGFSLKSISHGNLIEVIWTIIPAIILWLIGLPSLILLYLIDEILDADITIQVTGNQWYWNYNYTDYPSLGINFDSFLVQEEDLEEGDLRNLTVDNYLVLPMNTNIRLLVTANDVIHSFAIPSLGIKCDALPGRLNSAGLIVTRPSTFYGQCSELCGLLHGFMPVGLKVVTKEQYIEY